MKRCKFCARTGARLMALSDRPSGVYACHDRQACKRRAATVGQWTGVRVLRRRDLDGTEWTIRRCSGPEISSNAAWFQLTCEYRQHRATSLHQTVELAKAHCDDVTRSWEARSLRDYAGAR